MGESSSSASTPLAFGLLPVVSEKLTRGNYNMWYATVASALKGARLGGYILDTAAPPAEFLDPVTTPDGKKTDPVPNPAYEKWIAEDQIVLSYLFSSLSKEIFGQVATKTSAKDLWKAIQELHASQSRAHIMSTCIALDTATKGASSVAEFFVKMKGLADDMASAGRKLEDEELVTFIITGLDEEFESVISAVTSWVEPISVNELYAQLVAFEQRREIHGGGSPSSANLAAKGGRGGSSSYQNCARTDGRNDGGRGSGGRGNGGGRGNSAQGGGGGGRNFQDGVFCQLCGKEGHPVVRCFDPNFTGPPQKSASSANTSSYGVNSNWYIDSGATDHITGDLEKLSFRDKYRGGEQVLTANGAGMDINHIGHSTLISPIRDVHLNNILHVPRATKSLVSAHRLVKDNNAFLELHPRHFSLKEQVTKKTLLEGRCEGGLYPLKPHPRRLASAKQVLGVLKPSTSLWHSRLGHASSHVVQKVLSRHNLLFSKESSTSVVCDACQMGKSHQLPYPKSNSVSSKPFELVFSDVWGPAPTSVGRYSYYVSFIDDFSKFTWIYLLKHKSEVFQCFSDFQNMVERQFNHKILAVQSDWGVEY